MDAGSDNTRLGVWLLRGVTAGALFAVVEGLFAEQFVGLVMRLAQGNVTKGEVGTTPGIILRRFSKTADFAQ